MPALFYACFARSLCFCKNAFGGRDLCILCGSDWLLLCVCVIVSIYGHNDSVTIELIVNMFLNVKFQKFFEKKFGGLKKCSYLCTRLRKQARAFSSVGSEHLPYKQRVGGSNPSTPTNKIAISIEVAIFLFYYFFRGMKLNN